MIARIYNPQRGFTLVELTVVLLLITLLASVAVRETAELGFQTRYEQTKERLEMIKQAILGNPKLVINGQQAVSGFVADMGRLPMSVRELIDINAGATGYCGNKTYADELTCESNGGVWFSFCSNSIYTSQSACETNNALWIGKKSFGLCSDVLYQNNQTQCLANGMQWAHLFYGGWNGPYLSISGNPDEPDALTDGWGNLGAGVTDQSYGWGYFQLDALTGNNQDSGNLIIQSFGKNQRKDNTIPTNTDYENDYPPNLNLFGTDYFPNPTVLRQDWLVDISGGIKLNIKKPINPLLGNCGFSIVQALSFYNNTPNVGIKSCRNASGRWGESGCYLGKDACTDFGGTWEAITNRCSITQPQCVAPNTWDTETSSCHIAKAQCPTALPHPGYWTGASSCHFSQQECKDLNSNVDKWNPATGECEFDSTTCSSANGTWDATTGSCDFKPSNDVSTPQQCDTSTTPNSDKGIWGCNISQKSCNVAGGAWNRCDFTPNQCTNMVGGSYVSQCEFTNSACNRSGGSWLANSRQCQFTLPLTAPSTPAACEAMGAQWNSYCAFDTLANCTAQGGIWNAGSEPKQCEFPDTQCLVKGGNPREGDCSIPRAEHDGAPFNKQTCETATGVWNEHRQSVCLNVFYRNNGNLNVATSLPTLIEEDGAYQTVQFNFETNPVFIPTGQNAIGIYEYDGDCDPVNNPLYPADRQNPIQIDFHPNATLPVINW